MSQTHERYEMLTALATAGQLPESDLIDLAQHTRECVPCREAMVAMEAVSLAIFVAHATTVGRQSMPAGMQRRFEQRAASAGIPLRRSVAGTMDAGVLRLALVTATLAICAALSWSLITRTHLPVSQSQTVASLPVDDDHVLAAHPQQPQSVRRRPAHVHKAASSAERAAVTAQRSFRFPQPSLLTAGYARTFSDTLSTIPVTVNQQYMISGLHLPKRDTYQSTSLPITFGTVATERTDQRTFHYKPDFASLTFLDGPQASGLTATPALDFSRSPLHFNINQTW